MKYWVDGEVSRSVSLNDRGLHYGDGLFETIRVFNKTSPFLNWHLQRLSRSAETLFIKLDLSELRRFIDIALETSTEPHQILKVIITRGFSERAYRPDVSARARIIVGLINTSANADSLPSFSSVICQTRLAKQAQLAGIKHLNRLENVLAEAELKQADCLGILMDTDGNVIETTSANLFIIRNNTLYTDALNNCGVAGVAREIIIKHLAEKLDLAVKLQTISQQELLAADEVFCCNSVKGVQLIHKINEHLISDHSITEQIFTSWWKFFYESAETSS